MLIFKKRLLKNASLLTVSQIFSLLVSMIMIIILPRYVTVEDYGYWQLFILYSGYVGLLHFGYSDGLYIKLGGKNIKRISPFWISQQLNIFLILQLIFVVILFLISYNYFYHTKKEFVFYMLGTFLFIENYHKLLSFVLLATSESSDFALSVILDKVITIVLLSIAIILGYNTFEIILLIYVFCRFLSLSFLLLKYRQFIPNLYALKNFRKSFILFLRYCNNGYILTLSTIVGTLVLASGRLVVEYYWDIYLFAQISLAVSLSFFILAFISQVSLILFPILCNAEELLRKKILQDGSLIIGYISILSFGLYFILVYLIKNWLQDYKNSLEFLVYLFPLVLFEVKTQVLYITFCKVLNKLKLLLIINILILAIAIGIYFSAVKFLNIEVILFGMLISVMIRSTLLNIIITKNLQLPFDKNILLECTFVFLFIFASKLSDHLVIFYFILFLILISFYQYKKLKIIFLSFKKNIV